MNITIKLRRSSSSDEYTTKNKDSNDGYSDSIVHHNHIATTEESNSNSSHASPERIFVKTMKKRMKPLSNPLNQDYENTNLRWKCPQNASCKMEAVIMFFNRQKSDGTSWTKADSKE
jgi:hypothetical protein